MRKFFFFCLALTLSACTGKAPKVISDLDTVSSCLIGTFEGDRDISEKGEAIDGYDSFHYTIEFQPFEDHSDKTHLGRMTFTMKSSPQEVWNDTRTYTYGLHQDPDGQMYLECYDADSKMFSNQADTTRWEISYREDGSIVLMPFFADGWDITLENCFE